MKESDYEHNQGIPVSQINDMKELKILKKGYTSTHKVGEYEFLVKVHYMPLFKIVKLVRVKLALAHPKVNSDSWERSVIVRHSKSGKVIHMLISSCLEEVDYFKKA